MKKILAILSLSLALFSCGSGAADGVNETPSSTGDRVFVVDTSKSVSKSVSKNISKGINTSAWQTQYDSLISTINTKTGRNNDVDGYFVFDSYGNVKEMGIKSNAYGKFAYIDKYSTSSSNLPILLYNDNPDFLTNHITSTNLSQYDSVGNYYVTDNYTRTPEGLSQDMSDTSNGYTQKEIFASPTKNSKGEVESWYYNYNGLDGMEFTTFTSGYLSDNTNPKYVFNSDNTISLWSEGVKIEDVADSHVSYTYENGIVKTMTMTIGTKTYNWKYDSQGRVIESKGLDAYTDIVCITKYTYDSKGIVTSKTIQNDSTKSYVYSSNVTYDLNSDGTIKSFAITIVDDSDTLTISMTYTRDTSGNITNVHAKLMIPCIGAFEQDYIPKS